MDTFTIVLIVIGVALVLSVAIHEVRNWRRPGHHISQSAPMDSADNNTAQGTSRITNNGIETGGPM